jgi:hypothetical protein
MLSAPTQVAGHAFDGLALVRRPEPLLDRGQRDVTKLVLFPVRFLYTSQTGRIGRTDQAIAYFLGAEPAGPVADLVRAAASWRERLPEDHAAAVAALREGILPLYLRFIDDYAARLRAFGEEPLAARLLAWRSALTR